MFRALDGWLHDGSYGHGLYKNNLRCEYLIGRDDPVGVFLSFRRFDLHKSDWLAIYEGQDAIPSKLLGNYTGNVPPPPFQISGTSTKFLLVFVTDGSGVGAGWEADYKVNQIRGYSKTGAPVGVLTDGR